MFVTLLIFEIYLLSALLVMLYDSRDGCHYDKWVQTSQITEIGYLAYFGTITILIRL